MAEQLETFDFTTSNQLYDQWLDGSIWKVRWQEETKAKTIESFRSSLYLAARKAGMKVRTQVVSIDEIVIQATPRGD